MHNLPIGPGTRVTLHFALTLEDGTLVDSNFEGDPAVFVVGDGSLLPGYEQALFGLNEGEEATFEMPPEKGFGQHNPDNVQTLARSDFAPDMELEPGLVVSFADASKSELPGVIIRVEDDIVLVDFNHPLAGHTIAFSVLIKSVEPAVTH